MGSLVKWELKQTLFSKVFVGIGLLMFLGTFGTMLSMGAEEAYSGFEIFLALCSNFNSFLLFFVGIYCGITVTRAFEERRVQAAVMAGYSRLRILAAKLLSFSLSVSLFWLFTVAFGIVVISCTMGMTGLPGSFLSEVVLRILVYCLVLVSSSSICFLLSCLVRNLGTAIAVNLVAMLVGNGIVQSLAEESWGEMPLRLTAVGQTLVTLADSDFSNYLLACGTSVVGLVGVLFVTYFLLRKAELK